MITKASHSARFSSACVCLKLLKLFILLYDFISYFEIVF